MAAPAPSRSRSPRRNLQPEPSWSLIRKDLHPGCKVSLKGLNVRVNGLKGVAEEFAQSTGRWRVRLSNGQLRDFKPSNLVMEAPALVIDASKLPVGSPTTAPVEEQPRELHAGCKVALHGLRSAVDLNGQRGIVEEFVKETGRWRVKLDSGVTKDLRDDNLKMEEASKLEQEASDKVLKEVAELDAALHGEEEDAMTIFDLKPGDACGPGGRFIIEDKLGGGNFSTVFRCRDAVTKGMRYAVKFTHASTQMRKALEREIKLMGHLCTEIGKKDPHGVSCLITLAFFEGFEHKGRLAVAFELMKCNLTTALQKYGAGRGLPLLPTVRNFGKNIFLALRALRQAGIIHCDVKPANLLLSLDNESCKLCDFGAALGVAERISTDELQPRHYRSPEIILGQEYDTQIDVWSAGATLFQLATDTVLFPGDTNNDMIHEMLKVCGGFPKKIATTGRFALNHFHSNSDFLNAKGDMALDSTNPRVIPMTFFDPPSRPLQNLLEEALKEPPRGVPLSRHQGLVQHFVDLLSGCLLVNPAGRTTPEAALSHRFFQKGA